jgi:hypothetical protein
LIVKSCHPLVEESLSPERDHFASRIQPVGNFIVSHPFMGEKDNLRALN